MYHIQKGEPSNIERSQRKNFIVGRKIVAHSTFENKLYRVKFIIYRLLVVEIVIGSTFVNLHVL